MPLLINADDFGKSDSVNMAICEAFAKGLINRTTLMANMPAAKAAMELAEKEGFKDKVGIHLNLTEGRPITECMAGNLEMCDENGLFTADFHRSTLKRFLLSKATRKDIQKELDAQLGRYSELGGTLFHVDSHHHVHTDVSVLMPLMPLLKKYNVKSIRLGRNLYHGGNSLMRMYKRWLNKRLNGVNASKCDYFGSVKDYEAYGAGADFKRDNTIEIMVHPMYSDGGELIDTDYLMSEMNDKLGETD